MFRGCGSGLGVRVCGGCGRCGARELVDGGLMSDEGGRWTLTLRGRMVSNEVFGRLLEKSEDTSSGGVVQLREEIERAFGWRKMPDNVIDEKPENLLDPDSDILDALWFAGRDWRDITVEDWRQHFCRAYVHVGGGVSVLSAERDVAFCGKTWRNGSHLRDSSTSQLRPLAFCRRVGRLFQKRTFWGCEWKNMKL